MKLKYKIEVRYKKLKKLGWYYVLQHIEDFVRFYIFQRFLLFHDKLLIKKWIYNDIMNLPVWLGLILLLKCRMRLGVFKSSRCSVLVKKVF